MGTRPRCRCRHDYPKDAMETTNDQTADYDGFAAAYAAQNEKSLFNAHYNKPEILRLAGQVDGRRILDAGCGSGTLMAALGARGAAVSGFDLSSAMVAIARCRLGPGADLAVANLAAPLAYSTDEFDLAIASLSMHYVQDWAPVLAEFQRVLKPGGRLIVSIIHPTVYAVVYPDADYFTLTKYSEDYTFEGQTVWMTYWHRPLSEVLNSFLGAGFSLTTVTEPPPAPDTPPDLLPTPDGRPFICFLFMEWAAP